MTPHDPSTDELLDRLTEEISVRVRRGDRPKLMEYAARYPQLAEQIGRLLPALLALESAARPPVDVPELTGRLGDFRLLRAVGRGAMGTVYEAIHESLGRAVAVKVLHDPTSRGGLDRFRREARAAGMLQHPHVVPVYGVGEADGRPFYVMRFIAGAGLNQVLNTARRRRGLEPISPSGDAVPPAEPPPADWAAGERHLWAVVRVMAEVAEAVAHAHSQGVLHRDIKPANILVDADRHAWVTDFGLAKVLDDAATRSADVVGTLRYMAPERFRGENDPRCDVYAIGVTLYEAATLRPAFPYADRMQLLDAINTGHPPRPRLIEPAVSRDLETVIRKATAREPADRYPTAAALAADLRAVLADRPIAARRPSRLELTARWAKRNPAVAGLLAAVLVVVTVAGGGLFAQNRALDAAVGRTQASERAAEADKRQAQERLIDSLIAEARSRAAARRPGQRFGALARLAEARGLAAELGQSDRFTPALRDAAVLALAAADMYPEPVGEADGDGPVADLAVAAGLYVRTGPAATIEVVGLADGAVRLRIEHPKPTGTPPHAHLLAGGRYLVVTAVRTPMQVWRLDTTPPEQVLRTPELASWEVRSNGRSVYVHTTTGRVVGYDLPSGRQRADWPLGTNREFHLGPAHPSRPWLVVARATDPRWQVRQADTGEVLGEFTARGENAIREWEPGGRYLYEGLQLGERGGPFALDRYDADRGFARIELCPLAADPDELAFNPTGDRLAVRDLPNRVSVYDVNTGRLLAAVPGSEHRLPLRWEADDRLAGFIDGRRLGVWRVGDGRVFRVLPFAPAQNLPDEPTVAVHPGGRLLAAATTGGLQFWEPNTGARRGELPDPLIRQPMFETPTELRYYVRKGGQFQEYTRTVQPNDARGELSLGPPAVGDRPFRLFARSADGRVTIGVHSAQKQAVVYHRGPPARTDLLDTGFLRAQRTVSPDGRWAVITSERTFPPDVWDLERRAKGHTFHQPRVTGAPAFSPCGRWVWVNVDGGRLFRVGTWEPGPVTGPSFRGPAFSPDGRRLVRETGTGILVVHDTDTGRELLRLENPYQASLTELHFSPDGTRLLGLSTDNVPGLHLWDLQRLDTQLADLGLPVGLRP